MASNKAVRLGPVALNGSGTIANIFNPPVISGGVGAPGTTTACYYILRHIRIVNKTAGAVTFTGYVGATGASAAGTEFLGNALSISANSYVDWYGVLTMDIADFLTGASNTTLALTIEAEGEIGVR